MNRQGHSLFRPRRANDSAWLTADHILGIKTTIRLGKLLPPIRKIYLSRPAVAYMLLVLLFASVQNNSLTVPLNTWLVQLHATVQHRNTVEGHRCNTNVKMISKLLRAFAIHTNELWLLAILHLRDLVSVIGLTLPVKAKRAHVNPIFFFRGCFPI